jgi:tetratricopeptide (TPR) repeat protein
VNSEELLASAKESFQLGDYEAAEKIALKLVADSPKLPEVYILLGTIYSAVHKYPEAAKQFEQALKIYPDNSEAYNNLGVVYRQMGKLGQSLKAIEKSIELNPKSAEMWYNLGNVHKMDDNIPLAVDAYTKAIELDPEFVRAYNNLGTLYEKMGDYSKASEIFNRGLRSDPNHPMLRYNLGISCQAQGNLEDAKKQFEAAVRSRPGWVDGLNNLGIVLQNMGEYEESIQIFKEILSIDPKNTMINNNIASILAQQGRTKEAVGYFKKALEENGAYSKAAVNLGRLLENQQVSGDVLADMQWLVAHNPDNLDLKLQYANVLVQSKNYLEAEKQTQAVLGKTPGNVRALRMMGNICFRTDRRKKGLEYFTRILRENPNESSFRLDIARAFKDTADYEAALEEVDKFLADNPSDVNALNLYGEILLDQEKNDEALEHFKKIHEEFPDNGEIIANLARAYQQAGKKESAIEAADRLINLQGKRATPQDISDLNASLDLYEKTVEAFESDHKDAWARSLSRLGKLAMDSSNPGRAEAGSLLVDGFAEMDEDSIPVLDFGGTTVVKEEKPDEPDEEERLEKEIVLLDNVTPFHNLPEEGRLPANFTGGGSPSSPPEEYPQEETPYIPPPLANREPPPHFPPFPRQAPVPPPESAPAPQPAAARPEPPPEPSIPRRRESPPPEPVPTPQSAAAPPPPPPPTLPPTPPMPRRRESPPAPEPVPEPPPQSFDSPESPEPSPLPERGQPEVPQAESEAPSEISDENEEALEPDTSGKMEEAEETETPPEQEALEPDMEAEEASEAEAPGQAEPEIPEDGELLTEEAADEDFPAEVEELPGESEETGETEETKESGETEETGEEIPAAQEADGEEFPEQAQPLPRAANGERGASPAPTPASAPSPAYKPAQRPKRNPVILPEDTLGSEEQIQSMLKEIDAEEVPPPEPAPEPELEYSPPPQETAPPPVSKKIQPKPADGIKLLDYLRSLVACLPQEKRTAFTSSDYPLKIEAVKNMLLGRQGLHREFPEKAESSESTGENPVSLDKVKKSFDFVSRLAEHLPNQDVKTVLQEKLKSIEARLEDRLP